MSLCTKKVTPIKYKYPPVPQNYICRGCNTMNDHWIMDCEWNQMSFYHEIFRSSIESEILVPFSFNTYKEIDKRTLILITGYIRDIKHSLSMDNISIQSLTQICGIYIHCKNNLKQNRELMVKYLPSWSHGLHFVNNPPIQLLCTLNLRRIVSLESAPPIQEVIDSGIIYPLLQFVKFSKFPCLQFEALWVLTNIASADDDKQTINIIKEGGIDVFIDALKCKYYSIQEQAIWALGNIVGDNIECRDLVLYHKILPNILSICQLNIDIDINISYKYKGELFGSPLTNTWNKYVSLLNTTGWVISNLCRGKKRPNTEFIQLIIKCIDILLNKKIAKHAIKDHDNDIFYVHIGWGLGYLTDDVDDEFYDKLDELNMIETLIQFLSHNNVWIAHSCLRSVGNIISNSDKYTRKCIKFGVLKQLNHLLSIHVDDDNENDENQDDENEEEVNLNNYDKRKKRKILSIKREICWMISNVVARSMEQTMELQKGGTFPLLIDLIITTKHHTAYQALWALGNATVHLNESITNYLKDIGLIKAINLFLRKRTFTAKTLMIVSE